MFRTNHNALLCFQIINPNGQTAITYAKPTMISNTEPTASRDQKLAVIESNCKDLATLRAKLRRLMEARQKEINAAEAQFTDGIRELTGQCQIAREVLRDNLDASRELFRDPKSRTYFGIDVGYEKERDKLLLPADPLLVERIEKMLPKAQADTLLDRTTTVIKNAVKKLPRAILQKLGCSWKLGADAPIVRANDDDIEELARKAIGEVVETKEAA